MKPNEHAIKAGDGTLLKDDKKIPIKVILTNQNRIYLKDSGIYDEELNSIKDVMYFDRSFFNRDGVHIIAEENEAKFLIKNRKDWEILFSKMY